MLIFSYGSNMFGPRLAERVPSASKVTIAYLKGFVFACNKQSTDGSSKGNILQSDDEEGKVWGVIYTIDDAEKPSLDAAEGLGNGYAESTVTVTDANENTYDVQVYIAAPSHINNELGPYDWYKDFMLTGATINNLPEADIALIRSLHETVDPDENRRRTNYKILGIDV